MCDYNELFNNDEEYEYHICECPSFHENLCNLMKEGEYNKNHRSDCPKVQQFEDKLESNDLLKQFIENTISSKSLIIWTFNEAPSVVRHLIKWNDDKGFIVFESNDIYRQNFSNLIEDSTIIRIYHTSIGTFNFISY